MSPMAYIRKPPGIEDFSDRKYQNRRQISRLASVAIDYFKQSVKKIEAPVNVSDGVYPQTARDRRLFRSEISEPPSDLAPCQRRDRLFQAIGQEDRGARECLRWRISANRQGSKTFQIGNIRTAVRSRALPASRSIISSNRSRRSRRP